MDGRQGGGGGGGAIKRGQVDCMRCIYLNYTRARGVPSSIMGTFSIVSVKSSLIPPEFSYRQYNRSVCPRSCAKVTKVVCGLSSFH